MLIVVMVDRRAHSLIRSMLIVFFVFGISRASALHLVPDILDDNTLRRQWEWLLAQTLASMCRRNSSDDAMTDVAEMFA